MKTEREIRDKIDTIAEVMIQAAKRHDTIRKEYAALQVDALLWVLGDTSGLPLLDER